MASITASALRAEIISTRTSTNALASSHLHPTAGPSLPLRSAVGGRPSKRMIVRAADDKVRHSFGISRRGVGESFGYQYALNDCFGSSFTIIREGAD